MGIRIHDLEPADGSNKRGKRKARGIGGKGGKTAGRGTKGQRARKGDGDNQAIHLLALLEPW